MTMSRLKQRYVLSSQKQLAVLATATRQEIVDVLAEMGKVSVAEIAAALERPADALYFHIRALKRAGLVREAGHRIRQGRKEVLFRTVAADLSLRYEPRNEDNRKAITAIASSMLRLGIRDFRRALERADAVVSGRNRELWALRKVARLSPVQIAGLNRSIESIRHDMSRPHEPGRLYGVTILLTPLDHRRRENKRNAKFRKESAK
jgi:DNA-binding transcriptional ArsR family regulator